MLERVEPPLEAHDVRFAERRHVYRVRGLVDDRGTRECHLFSLVQRPQRVAQARVDDERAVVEPPLERTRS